VGQAHLATGLPGPAHRAFQPEAEIGEPEALDGGTDFGERHHSEVGSCVGEMGGGDTGEGGGSLEVDFHRGATRSEGNIGEGRRLVVDVDGSPLRKVVRTQAVIGAASMERFCGRRRLGGGR
jgi:hypothetical protein